LCEGCDRHREIALAGVAALLALDDVDNLDIPGPNFREGGLAMDGMDAGRAVDRRDLRLDLPAALIESHLELRREVEHRNRHPDRLACRPLL
jgi:hypothetical protein